MGPFAGARFCTLLLEKCAKLLGPGMEDHFPEIVLDSVPVPEFISNTRSLPKVKSMLISRIKRLNKFGCTSIGMVCNTGHIIFPELLLVSGNKMVSLIDSVRDKVVDMKLKRVGLLATKTTIKSRLFNNSFSKTDVNIINQNKEMLDICEKVIRNKIANVNSNFLTKKLINKTEEFIKKENLDGVILGCTELPLAFPKNKPKNIIDCLDVFSDKLLDGFDGKPRNI